MTTRTLQPDQGPPQVSISSTNWLLLVALSLVWGSSFAAAKIAVAEVPPITVSFVRIGLGSLVLFAFARAMGLPLPKTIGAWLSLIPMALLNNAIPFTLVNVAQASIPSGLGAILNTTSPLFAVLVTHFTTQDDKLTWNRLLGVIAGMIGVTIMIGPALLGEIGTDVLAQGAALLAALFFALGARLSREYKHEHPLSIATAQIIVATWLLLPMSLAIDRPWTLPMPSWTAIAMIVLLGVITTAVGHVLFFYLVRHIGATNTMLNSLLQPVTALLIGITLLHEQIQTDHVLGMAAIAIGLIAIDGRLLRRLRRKPP